MGAMCSADASVKGGEISGDVKIHGLPISSNSMGPILLATEVGCGAIKPCDITKGESRTPEFLKMSPFHTIPCMEDGKYYIGESQAMLRYLARKYKPELYPSDAKLAARADWACDAWGTTIYGAFADIGYPVLGFAAPPKDPKAAIAKMKDVLDMFCASFMHPSYKYVCGDQLSIAEYKALPFLYVLNHPVVEAKSGCKLGARLKKYTADMLSDIKASSMLTDTAGFSLQSYLDGKKAELPDFKGAVTECGFGQCSKEFGGAGGPALKVENKAKVHGLPVSCNTLSVVMLAKDKGVGNMEVCNLMTGDHMKPEYLAKNPFHQIPTFECSGGFCLGESNATLRFIATHYAPDLYPDNLEQRGRIDWAMDAIATGINKKLCYTVVYPILGFAEPPADQAVANKDCTTALDEFEAAFLQSGKFVCGDKVTIAEYKFLPFLYAAAQPAIEKKQKFKLSARLQTYLKDVLGAVKCSTEVLEGGDMNLKGFCKSKE